MNEIILSNTAMPIITEFGLLAASEPFYHLDRLLNFNVMIYVTDGIIYVTEEETDYEVNTGELLFLKSGKHHYGKYEINRGTRWYYAHFYLDSNTRGNNAVNNCTQKIILPKKLANLEDSPTASMIEKCNDDFFSNNHRRRWSVNARFFDILTELAFIDSQGNTQKSLSDRICEYLSEHCREPFSAKTLENEFYLSYKYMASVFKKDCNITMQQYHTQLRMKAACRMLRSTLIPVSEIAAAVGYNDALYFSRCFHSVTGVSPTAYRKNVPYISAKS